jgi:hypothetical protein
MGEGNRNTALIVLVIVLVAAAGLGIICCGGGAVLLYFWNTGPIEPVAPPGRITKSEVNIVASLAEIPFSHTISVETEYYLGGPQQAQPPDGTFKAGTEVRLLAEGGSYCLVESEDGVVAWVAADALKPVESGK